MNYIDDLPELDTTNNFINDTIINLNWINHQIAELADRKQKAENKLQNLLNHNLDYEGQKQYIHDKFAITIKTGWNWSFDKNEYEIMKNNIPDCFNPVRISTVTKQFLDKNILHDIEQYSNGEDAIILSKIFFKEPKKVVITIKPRKV